MKKAMAFAAVAVLVIAGARWHHHSRGSALAALSPAEKQSLHDAPNDEQQSPDSAPQDSNDDTFTGEKLPPTGILGRIADLKRATTYTVKQALPNKSVPDIDLRGEWKDASRNQGFIGNCHIYASVGLVEAALFRAHGQKIHINENDLFLNSKVLSPMKKTDAFEAFRDGGNSDLEEGAWNLESDIDYLFKNGASQVANENPLLLQDFGVSWNNYKSVVSHTLDVTQNTVDMAVAESKIPNDQYTGYAVRGQIADSQRKAPQIDAMTATIEQQAGSQDLEAARVDLRKEMAGLRLFDKELTPFNYDMTVPGASKGMCAQSEQGRDILNAIETELEAHHPVGLVMNLQGLKEWGVGKSEVAGHAIIINGMQRKALGGLKFTTRNSWGHNEVTSSQRPNNPELTPDQICRINELYVVLTPDEPAPSAPGFKLIATAAPPSPVATPHEPPSPVATAQPSPSTQP
jgi:hypothetical protein